jgi:hypothetical protein
MLPCLTLKCGRIRPFSSPGGLAERLNAADLKSVSPQGLGGSNPSPSAIRFPLGVALLVVGAGAIAAAPQTDRQLVGRWCSTEVTVRSADGTTTSNKSNASQYMVQTFSKDRTVVEWVRLPQWARWTQSYAIVAAGELSMTMLEHSSLPGLVGSKSVYRYRMQGDTLKLLTEPREKRDPVVESTWIRCQD